MEKGDAPPPYPGAVDTGVHPQSQPGYYQAGYAPPPGVIPPQAATTYPAGYIHNVGHFPTVPPTGYGPYVQQPPQVTVISGAPRAAGTNVTVIHGAPMFFGANPINVTCPHCGSQVVTATTTNPGLLTWLLCGMCVLFGCWLGCCLIPFCIPECQDVEHSCPNCHKFLGTNRRM